MVRIGWRRDLFVTGAFFAALLLWDLSAMDTVLTRWFGTAHGFPWRDHWLTRGVLHEGGRVLAWLVLGALLVNVPRPLIAGPTRSDRLRMLGLTLACVLVVPALKQASATSCPWDLAEFGGTAFWVSHWQFGLSDGGPGRCFPSGHATAAFAFLGGYVGLRPSRPDLARRWLAAVLLAGAVFGGAQLVRGAHHASHTLWSAFACWVVCLCGAPRKPRGRWLLWPYRQVVMVPPPRAGCPRPAVRSGPPGQ